MEAIASWAHVRQGIQTEEQQEKIGDEVGIDRQPDVLIPAFNKDGPQFT